jgi:hypothetical protein
MARLIDIIDAAECPANLTLEAGDLLRFGATGGRVRSGSSAVEMLGPFIPGVLSNDGEIISPAGPPGTVLFLARRPGRAVIDVIIGDPFHTTATTTIAIDVTA